MTAQDNFEELQEDEDEFELPTVHDIAEFAMACALDLENSLDFDEDPMEQVVNLNINAGMMLFMMYEFLELYGAVEDQDLEALEAYVKARKLSPPQTEFKH